MSKQETVNTFDGGLIMDLNPIVTPNNVLTGALNATSITYDGNEFVLQNDMGNGEVHTARLDKGYIPIGMKEHGGIIYVAAYNPITKKGQIGSFPSPQQLYSDSDLSTSPVDINFNQFVTIRTVEGVQVPFIISEYRKQKLFQENNSEEAKTFHPGDKFILTAESISDTIKQAIEDGAVSLRLGVINSSGNIDYVDSSTLRLYDNNLWIYETDNTEEALTDNSLVQVFSAKSSGVLVLVVELKTFSKFNLIRKYKYDEDTKLISVILTGEMDGDSPLFQGKTNVDSNVSLYGSTTRDSTKLYQTLTISQNNTSDMGKVDYSIMPVSVYGVLERMVKNGTIDFSKIRPNKEDFNEWRFFVSDNYIKIGWGYDYYNMNEDEGVEKMVFRFIDINVHPDDPSSYNSGFYYEISKEYYNGSFEEIIPFDSLKKNWLYVVRIDKYVTGVSSVVAYRLLYTGTLFNEYYNGNNKDFNFLQIPKQQLSVEVPVKVEVVSSKEEVYLKKKENSSPFPAGYTLLDNVTPGNYLTYKASLDSSIAGDEYTTKKKGTYKINVSPELAYKYDSKKFAGFPEELTVEKYYGSSPTISSGTWEETPLYSADSNLTPNVTTDNNFISSSYNASKKAIEVNLSTTRTAYATSGNVESKTLDNYALLPLYTSGMRASDRDRIFSFKESNGVLTATSGDEDCICYNSKFYKDQGHTEGLNKGTSTGSHDDDGLQTALNSMGNGTVGIFGGHDKDNASLHYGRTRISRNGWWSRDNEVDDEDNFLLATWMDTNGSHWVINLGSRKTETSNVNSETDIIRLPEMLKCIMSQICTVRRSNVSKFFAGPNSEALVYHLQFETHYKGKVKVTSPGESTVDFYLGDTNSQGNLVSIREHIQWWKSKLGDKLENFIPEFYIYKPTDAAIDIPFGNTLRIDNDINILGGYTNAYSYFSTGNTDTTADKGKIYIASTTDGTLNADGSVKNIEWDSNGSVVPASNQRNIRIWGNRTISLPEDINNIFVNEYSVTGSESELNRILINPSKGSPSIIGKWTKGKKGHAPDMKSAVYFGGNTNIYQPYN